MGSSRTGLETAVLKNVKVYSTVWRCAVTGEDFIFRLAGVEEEEMVQITDPISQRADGEISSSEGHEVPHHPFSCKQTHKKNHQHIAVGFRLHIC